MESTPMNTESNEQFQLQQPQEFPSNNTYHQSCETLLYWDFVKIKLNKDLTLLGTGSQVELQTAWSIILQEYVSLIHTDKSDTILNCYLKIAQTEARYTFLQNALTYLKYCEWDKDLVERISLFGYDYIEPLEDREAYLKQIYIAQNEIKALVILLDQYNTEYNSLTGGSDATTEARTMMDYERDWQTLRKFQGGGMNKKKLTVFEFCAILNNFFDANKATVQ